MRLHSSFRLVPLFGNGRGVRGVGDNGDEMDSSGYEFDYEDPNTYGMSNPANVASPQIDNLASTSTSPATSGGSSVWNQLGTTFGSMFSNIAAGATPSLVTAITGQPYVPKPATAGPGAAPVATSQAGMFAGIGLPVLIGAGALLFFMMKKGRR